MKTLGRHIAAVLVLLAAVSCGEKEETAVLLDVSFKTTTVTSDQSQVLVSVKSDADWTLSVTDGDWGWFVELSDDGNKSVETVSGTGNRNSIILGYQDNPGETERTLTITATSGRKSAEAVLTQSGYKVAEAETVTTASGGISASAPYSWMELPATKTDDGFDFIYHNMTVSGMVQRNYSLYWDYDNLVAHWVAYPQNSSLIGRGSRSNAWNVDPFLSTSRQPVLYGGYKDGNNGWYARGHQIPSADRYVGNSNAQTFYGTNMTPQINDTFNSTVWATLESKVRDYAANSDTLYVVTGCILDGAKYYCYDNVGKKVTVPTGYYKAVLRYSPGSTITQSTGGYMGCAFFFEHKAYSSSYSLKSAAMSIDQLEEKIGLDLFVNLPAAIGSETADAVEAADPTRNSWWGL